MISDLFIILEEKKMKSSIQNLIKILLTFIIAAAMIISGVMPAFAQPSEVWVDASYCNGCPNDGHSWSYDAFAKIQDGIDAAASPGTVYVSAGTYVENITLKEGVQALGAGAGASLIDGGGAGTVVTGSNNNKIEGFTIRGGAGTWGGGIGLENCSSVVIANNEIIDNTAQAGGGIHLWNCSDATIEENRVAGNSASYGAGIYVQGGSVLIARNWIEENISYGPGGGIQLENTQPTTTIRENHLSGNRASDGGGLAITGSGSPSVSNNLITNNFSNNGGGGIYIHSSYSAPLIINNTIVGNSKTYGAGGVHHTFSSEPPIVISNNILWDNDGEDLRGCTAIYSDIQNGDTGEGNISADPMFVNPSNGVYRLQPASPCIDAGTNLGAPNIDIRGNSRPVDGDKNGAAVTDMGAYEFQNENEYVSAPTADFIVDRTSGPAPLIIKFADRSVGTIDSWSWDFGDGTTSSEKNPSHTYISPGTYSVSVTVTNPIGSGIETKSDYISVSESPTVVWVDDDYNPSGYNDGHTWNYDAYSSIQEGVDAVASPGTVHVAAGYYVETVTLKGGVEVLGAGAEVTTIDGGGNGSVVRAHSVGTGTILDGFKITNGIGTPGEGAHMYDRYGGGIYISNSTLVLRNCTITENSVAGGAGGIEAYDSTVSLYNNNISNNHGSWGGAITLHNSIGEINSNTIDQNDCYYGGAIYLTDFSQATITNNQITRNGLAIGIGESSTAVIINSTISGNSGNGIATGTYAVGFETGSATITNCILWDNNDDLANFSATYSNIQDADPGEGNISAYPMFVDTAKGDYHLKPGSPCIDAGISEGSPVNDLDGELRPYDGDGNGEAAVDMGADEFSGPVPAPFPSELWVDDNYCNGCSNDGHIWGYNAFAKIQDGIDALALPGTVHVFAGTYMETIWLRSGVIVSGAGAEVTVIDGGGNSSVVKAHSVGFGTIIDGFKITNGTGIDGEGGYTYGGGLYISNSTLTIRNCIITENRASNGAGGIEAYNSIINVFKNNIIENSGWWGGAIALHKSSAEVIGNVVDNNELGYGGAIFLTDSTQATIANNQITRNKLGIGIGESSDAVIFNNTIVHNQYGIATESGMVGNETGSATITNCILWGNGDDLSGELGNLTVKYTNIEFGYPGEGNISSDPMFLDHETGDYHLRDYSPCIGAGTAEDAPDSDIEGNPRPTPAGSNPDMGAYENTLGVSDVVPPDLPVIPVRLTNTTALPAIAVSETGYVTVVWKNDSNPNLEYGIYYAQKPPMGNWSTPELVAEGTGIIQDPQVVYDREETLHVVWQDYIGGSGVIRYASKNITGAWSVPVELSTGPSGFPSLTIDNENTVHVVWVQDGKIFYNNKPVGGGWALPVNLSETSTIWPSEPEIAVSIQGIVGVLWLESNPTRIVFVSKGLDGTWTEPVTLATGMLGSPKIAAGSDGTMYTLWEQNGVIYKTLPPGGDWSEPTLISVEGAHSRNVIIDDINGIFHVTGIGSNGIFHAYSFKGCMWLSDIIFPVDWVSDSATSAVLGKDNLLHISWFRREWTNHGVWYGEYVIPIDSDGDCLSDEIEGLLGTNPHDLDTDDDGISDGNENSNHNGIVENDETDPTKVDTDGDGIQDGTELGVIEPIIDPDGEGPLLGTDTALFVPDFDPSSISDPLNPDTDGDGVNDGEEDINHNGRFDLGETDPARKPLDQFGMAVDNRWAYEGTSEGQPYSVEREITAIDQDAFPVPTYLFLIKENGIFVGTESYENTGEQIKLWGTSAEYEGSLYNIQFSEGLLVASYPMTVNDNAYSSTTAAMTQFPGLTFNVSIKMTVVDKEPVSLSFDTIDAYKVSYELRVWGNDIDVTDTFHWWMVPYIGVVKDQGTYYSVELSTFAIGGGDITHESDADGDNLSDYQEIFVYNTIYKNADTDGDGCLDGVEVQGGRDPKLADSQGDLNADCAVDLLDAIMALQIQSSALPETTIAQSNEVNGDGKIGMEEVIYTLQKVSGLRQ